MAAAFRTDGVTFTTAAGNKTVTLTPAVGDLFVVFCARTTSTATPTVGDDNTGGTYSLIDGALGRASGDKLFAFVRDNLFLNTAPTIVTLTQSGDAGGGLNVLAISGCSVAGLAAIRQSGKKENQAAGTTNCAFPAAGKSNLMLGAIFNATNTATMTAPASWTERRDVGFATPTTGLETATRDSGETGTTITWGSNSASSYASMVVELTVPILINVFDAVAVTELVQLPFYIRTLGDSTTVTELVQLPFYLILSDATTITESQTALLPILLVNINQESTLVMTDAPTVNWVLSMALAEATAVSEVQTVLLPVLVPSVNEATGVTEFSLIYWPLTISESEATGVSDVYTWQLVPASPIFLVIGESLAVDELSAVLLPILNCAVNEVIITTDAAPLTIGGHGREIGPALITDVDAIT